jgi:hypothetical protein
MGAKAASTPFGKRPSAPANIQPSKFLRHEHMFRVISAEETAMPLFASKLDRALATCAKTLPARLAQDYGASEAYTKGQINKAMNKLKLDPKVTIYAYAMFLQEAEYDNVSPTYSEARAAFMRHMPEKTVEGLFYESGLGLTGGGNMT